MRLLKLALLIVFFTTPSFAFDADVEQVCFSPSGNCQNLIIQYIENAKEEIKVQAYSFTSAPIAKALLSAYQRGIAVEVLLDKSQKTEKYSIYKFFENQGIPVQIDAAHAIAHNKIIIIDQQIVITGSYNFTQAAESKNAENIIVLESKELANIYLRNWGKHKAHSW